MKKTIILSCIMMITIFLSAQAPPDTLWTRTYSRGSFDRCNSVQQTTDGGYILVGRSLTSGSYDFDAWIIKTDKNGDSLWSKTYGDYYVDEANVVKQTSDGGYIIGGVSTQFGWAGEGWLIKTDDQGNVQWQNGYHAEDTGTSDWDYIYDLVITDDGSYVAAGFTTTWGKTHEGWVLKVDTDGSVIWNRHYGNAGDYWDRFTDIKHAGDGDYIVAGDRHVKYGNVVGHDGWLMKVSDSGDSLWSATFGGSETDIFRALCVNSDGTIIAGGETGSYGKGHDAWLVKTDAEGNEIWNNTYGEGAISSVLQTSEMYYVAVGMRSCSATCYDGMLIKTYEDGSFMWEDIVIGSDLDDMFETFEQTFDGGYILGGRTNAEATSGDCWLVKMSTGIVGDFNRDGYVDATDLQMFGDHWFFVDTDPGWNAVYDLEPDGVIDAADLQVFGDHWNEGTPPESAKDDGSKGPNTGAGIVFDLDATTAGNQNLTHVSSQAAGTMIRVDVYATGVHNLDTYEFNVVYDPNVLEYKGCAATNPLTFEENILTKNGGTAIGWMVDNNDTTGVLNIAYTLSGTDTTQAPEGEGLIADIVFQAKVTTYGMLSFSDVYYYDTFGVKDAITNTGTATLPVELSAFTATYNDNGYTTLSWTTASETDILGYNVYRSTEDAFDASKQVNAAMIDGHGTTTEMNTYEFVDLDQLNFGMTYYYWLESIEYGGMSTVYTSIKLTPEEGNGGFVDDFSSNSLSNYPNPFRNTTTISYSIKGMLKSEPVQISIYNMLGQLVETVEGRYGIATWNTKDHSTGIYFYKLNTDSYTEIKKMMVTK